MIDRKCENCKSFCNIMSNINLCAYRNCYVSEEFYCDNHELSNAALGKILAFVRCELLSNKDHYNTLVASILSAIEDINRTADGTMLDSELAKHIADRIIGV